MKGADWIQDQVAELHPDENFVVTKSGRRIGYDYLVLGLGIQIDWSKIPGLQEGIGRNQFCSNYSYQQVDYTLVTEVVFQPPKREAQYENKLQYWSRT